MNQNSESVTVHYPEYSRASSRIRTFADWPRNQKPKPLELSMAGFFYNGYEDSVTCYSCGGRLRDWSEKDNPYEQHALWLGYCHLLYNLKGEEYVRSIRKSLLPMHMLSNESIEPDCNLKHIMCKICYIKEYKSAFLPCGHVTCEICSKQFNFCPVCRCEVSDIVTLYFP